MISKFEKRNLRQLRLITCELDIAEFRKVLCDANKEPI